jgi:hypothetical protein
VADLSPAAARDYRKNSITAINGIDVANHPEKATHPAENLHMIEKLLQEEGNG